MKPMHLDGRAFAALLHDGAVIALAWAGAAWLLAPGTDAVELEIFTTALAFAIPIQVGVNFRFGVYQGIDRKSVV